MGIFLAIIASVLLSLKGIFAKLIYATGASVDATLFYRFAFSVPLVLLFLFYKKKAGWLKQLDFKEWKFIALLSFLGYYLGSKTDYIALSLISAGISRLILFYLSSFCYSH